MTKQPQEPITIEVVYALPHEQTLIQVTANEDSSVEEAVGLSGILSIHPEITLEDFRVGIYGKPVPITQKLKNGDRVEIYRPLAADPREARRLKLESKRKTQLSSHHRRQKDW